MLRLLLTALSYVYGMGVRFVNALYDYGALKSVESPLPTICVGNITVGGTGKTPMIESLIREKAAEGQMWALLSRGYKRKSKGLVVATPQSTAEDIGDEPMQMHVKFPELIVVVCADRNKALRHIKENMPQVRGVLMDDGMQHRSTKAHKYIMMCDYNRLPYNDRLMPAGSLREPFCGRLRADEVVVNKCPQDISEQEREEITRRMRLAPNQKISFARIRYSAPNPRIASNNIVALAGIGNPEPFFAEVKRLYGSDVKCLHYSDHHSFTPADILHIKQTLAASGPGATLLCTEKDFQRLPDIGFPVSRLEITLERI